jgi:UDP-N-acetylglucosamine acyltransferase
MAAIDPTARVESGAVIGPQATIGPYCIIGPNAVIGEGCRLIASVHLTGHTTIGPRTVIYPFASLGTPPQSVKYRGGPTRLSVGADCDIREGVTMNTGTEDGAGVTRVGDRCFFMAGSHVGHDSVVGNDVTFANNAIIGGHVSVGDHVFFGGHTAMHQFLRVGEGAMIAGMTAARDDIIPFGFVLGQTGELVGLNIVGLRRRGASRSDMHRLRRAYRLLFFGAGRFAERVEAVASEFAGDPVVGKIVAFIRDGGSRPLMKARPLRAADEASNDAADGQA